MAEAAHAHEFIVELPEQYETQIGERGNLLSVGQKQRIALARAFLKNTPILILDEPTAALDSVSAALILKSLHEFKRSRTLLMITHSPSVIEEADRTLILSRENLQEQFKISNLPS